MTVVKAFPFISECMIAQFNNRFISIIFIYLTNGFRDWPIRLHFFSWNVRGDLVEWFRGYHNLLHNFAIGEKLLTFARDRNIEFFILLFLHDFSSLSCWSYTSVMRGVSLDARPDLLRLEKWHLGSFDHHLGRCPREECGSFLLTAYATLCLVARINCVT